MNPTPPTPAPMSVEVFDEVLSAFDQGVTDYIELSDEASGKYATVMDKARAAVITAYAALLARIKELEAEVERLAECPTDGEVRDLNVRVAARIRELEAANMTLGAERCGLAKSLQAYEMDRAALIEQRDRLQRVVDHPASAATVDVGAVRQSLIDAFEAGAFAGGSNHRAGAAAEYAASALGRAKP